jgi:hypothetical protein
MHLDQPSGDTIAIRLESPLCFKAQTKVRLALQNNDLVDPEII